MEVHETEMGEKSKAGRPRKKCIDVEDLTLKENHLQQVKE